MHVNHRRLTSNSQRAFLMVQLVQWYRHHFMIVLSVIGYYNHGGTIQVSCAGRQVNCVP